MTPFIFDRRELLKTFGGGSLAQCVTAAGSSRPNVEGFPSSTRAELARLERAAGGRLGVHAIHTGTRTRLEHRADERFPMCSTHKVLTAGAVLAAIDKGRLGHEHRVPYGPSELLDYAPVTRSNASRGWMTVTALCEAAVRRSDNTAANLLLALIGGPSGWTRYARAIGDDVSSLDRLEPDLNEAKAGDDRDTTSPRAMSQTLAALLLGETLSDASRFRLKAWMYDGDLTASLFRAGVPSDWHVADKSGSGDRATRNDIGILFPSRRSPIILSVFSTGSKLTKPGRDALIAKCAAIVVHHHA